MAEFSMFWTTGTTGDGTNPYTESQLFSWLRRTFNSDHVSSGPLKGYNDGLAVTAGTGSVTVGTGAAYVYGIPYENDAPLSVPIPTPTAYTRRDRIVLRADWSTKTVRITRLAGTEGAGAPNLTQNPGAIYEVPLALVTVTTGGEITVTDERQFCRFATEVTTENLADRAVTAAKIAGGPGSGVHADLLDGLHLSEIRSVGAIVKRTTPQEILSGSPTVVSFSTELVDIGDCFDPNRPDRITAPTNGVYLIWAQVRWAANSVGQRILYIALQGTLIASTQKSALSSEPTPIQHISMLRPLQAGQYVQIQVFQNSGGALNIEPYNGEFVGLGMFRLCYSD